jgi:hypothetical protein
MTLMTAGYAATTPAGETHFSACPSWARTAEKHGYTVEPTTVFGPLHDVTTCQGCTTINSPESETTMTELENEAQEIGRSNGYDHANYVEAYGGDMNATPEVPARFADVDESFYLSGYEEGVTNYKEGLFADGTPREDDETAAQWDDVAEGEQHLRDTEQH